MRMETIQVKSYSEYRFSPLLDAPAAKNKFELDCAVEKVRQGSRIFARLSLDERIELARSMQRGYLAIAERSVALGCAAKGIAPGSPPEGEEWATGPMAAVRTLRLIIETLESLKKTGNTPIGRTGTTPAGNLAVRVFPAGAVDALLFRNVTVDVHLQEGITAAQLASTRARFYKQPDHSGRAVLVLAAGNLAMLPVMDVLTKMFNEGKGCVLKMNPVNAYLGPLIEEAFSAAVERGYLSIVYGGGPEGEYLVRHPGIDEIHMTGSDRTFNTIVWGPPGPERDRRIENNKPLIGKKITSELGNVSPVIVTPGPYTDRELRFMAEDIAGYFTMNASFLCCAAKVLVLAKGWDKRQAFLDILVGVLESVPLRRAYYPGTTERFDLFTHGRRRGRVIGTFSGESLPWTLVAGIDPKDGERLFAEESFCPVLAETAVGSSDPVDFLASAVGFANDRLWGTLSATLMVHPEATRDPGIAQAVERAIDRLRYGTVCVNAFPGMSFVFGTPPWGAYPGSGLADIRSGQGWVHNTSMIEGIEKVVARFPFMSFPKPAYFPNHRTVHT